MNRSSSPTEGKITGLRIILTIMLPFSCGYFLSYLYRTVNSVIGGDLIRDMSLSAGDLGFLTAVYLLTFAAVQIPVGILLDRYWPRRVNAALLAVAALGALLFALGENKTTLIVARGLIGLGVSAALMASLKIITQCFPQARWPLMNGIILAVGGVGAIAGTGPVQAALSITDWRGVFFAIALATLLVALFILLVVPERELGVSNSSPRAMFRELRLVYVSRVFWALAPIVITAQATNMAIQGLWAGPWLRDVGGLGREDAAAVLVFLNIGLTTGFIGSALIAELGIRRGFSLFSVMASFLALFFIVQTAIVFEAPISLSALWFAFGFFSGGTILCYPVAAAFFPLNFLGRSNTALNLSAFVGAFIAQFAIGGIIDLFPQPAKDMYSASAYQTAFGSLLILQIAAFLWLIFAFNRLGKEPKHIGAPV
jgi:predicted MFS family arabinose efflux permease